MASKRKPLLCRLGLHPKPPVVEGDDPWPVEFTCPRCGGDYVDWGPEH